MSDQLPSPELIAAIVPCYGPGGDNTSVILTDGTICSYPVCSRTFLRRIAHSLAVDLTALKSHTAKVTKQKLLHALPLTPRLLLCPLKVRKPRAAKDSCYGYVNFHAVTGLQASEAIPYRSTIGLAGGSILPSLWTVATIDKQLQYAKLTIAYSQPNRAYSGIRESPAGYTAELTDLIGRLLDIAARIMTIKSV